jgi:tRNA threonylcarbamoyladenosine modification (KEOPS) complex  Pcc1 subunit
MPPMPHEAVFRFKSKNAGKIYQSLLPELSDEVNIRSSARCTLEGDDVLVLYIAAEDTSALRASLNMHLRLIGVADEMQDLV